MTHVMATENRADSQNKGKTVAFPVTVIECPPIKVFGIVAYKFAYYGRQPQVTVLANNIDNVLSRTISLPKNIKKKMEDINPGDICEVRLLVHTQPGLTGIGKKKPEVFEIPVGGKPAEQLEYAKSVLGKELKATDIISEGMQVDIHSITKGKGLQGPVKRFGVALRSHKAEKTKRGPGSLGGWASPRTSTVAHAGRMGTHLRTERNKWVMKISDNPSEINPAGGFIRYGNVKNSFILLCGSIPGVRNRLIKITHAERPTKKMSSKTPTITHISKISQQ
jgi:large subunit ribosomal protein L3